MNVIGLGSGSSQSRNGGEISCSLVARCENGASEVCMGVWNE